MTADSDCSKEKKNGNVNAAIEQTFELVQVQYFPLFLQYITFIKTIRFLSTHGGTARNLMLHV